MHDDTMEENELRVSRLEVIDHRDPASGRVLVIPPQKDPFIVTLSVQDEGRTLKIFMNDED